MLTPAFHFNILEAFLPAMNEQSQVLVTKIRQQVIESQEKGAVLDVVPYITYAALDIICGEWVLCAKLCTVAALLTK